MLLAGRTPGSAVRITLPSGDDIFVPVVSCRMEHGRATALVRKHGGDDPDETHGLLIGARVSISGAGITITGGRGVGRITRPGLAISPGNPAINPVPLKMIRSSVSDIVENGLLIEIFVPGGEKAAARTFNQRLGILGGISILGTSGIVRPFSVQAVKETIALNISMVIESGLQEVVLVPGHIGYRAALNMGFDKNGIVEVSNEWDFALKKCREHSVAGIVLAGHPGKLLKFIKGDFQTHSSRSASAVRIFESLVRDFLGRDMQGLNTVEQGIQSLEQDSVSGPGNFLAREVRQAVQKKMQNSLKIRVILIDLKGKIFGDSQE